MERGFGLIKNEGTIEEKRVFPRFPFSYLTFKSSAKTSHVFEVRDISHSGMQLSLRDGDHGYQKNDNISGELRWRGARVTIEGVIQWEREGRIGVRFNITEGFKQQIDQFLSFDNIISSMKAIHRNPIGFDLPANLKYWLKSDGPVELFVWTYLDGEISHFQMIILNYFVEWEDAKGVRTGCVVSKRDIENALIIEDEFIFEMDQSLDLTKVQGVKDLLTLIPANLLPEGANNFLRMRLGV